MVRMVLSLYLTGAAACPSVAGHLAPVSPSYVQPQYTLALKSRQGNEIHSVLVDMPQVESLEFASPDTWYNLSSESLPD